MVTKNRRENAPGVEADALCNDRQILGFFMGSRVIAVSLALSFVLASGICPACAQSTDAAELAEKGKSAIESGRLSEAVDIFSRLLAGSPGAEYLYYRGVAYSAMGKDQQALQDFDRAISLEPRSGLLFLKRGESFVRTGQFQDAINDLTKAFELDPQSYRALAYRGRAHFQLKWTDKALADLSQAIRLNPGNAWLHRLRGDILVAGGDHRSAVEDYDRALQLAPGDPVAYNNRAVALANLGKMREAMDDVKKSMDIADSNASRPEEPRSSDSPR